jgi:hypothetical protein
VYGPCPENERLGRTVGTDACYMPSDPQLRINGGRFTLKRHAHSSLSNVTYSYQLAGHAVAGGFAGRLSLDADFYLRYVRSKSVS